MVGLHEIDVILWGEMPKRSLKWKCIKKVKVLVDHPDLRGSYSSAKGRVKPNTNVMPPFPYRRFDGS